MKKLFNLFLVGILCLGLTACGTDNSAEVEELREKITILEEKVAKLEKETITTEELRNEWSNQLKTLNIDASMVEVEGNYLLYKVGEKTMALPYEIIDGNLYVNGWKLTK